MKEGKGLNEVARLFEAKLAVIDTLVQYQKALIELELVSGTTLQTHNLDLTKPQLENRTAALFKQAKWSPSTLEKYAREAAKADPSGNMGPTNLDQRRALETLRKEMATPTPYPALTPEEQQKAIEILRQKMKENP
jgi:hypothetical protein